jgi:hypothetical protein
VPFGSALYLVCIPLVCMSAMSIKEVAVIARTDVQYFNENVNQY